MSAAVADFSAASPSSEKIKRERHAEDEVTLTLKKNPDILKSLGGKKKNQILIGFALETEDGAKNAMEKLKSKNLDAIVLNNPSEEGAGFNTDTNIISVLKPDGTTRQFPRMSKFDAANLILNEVVAIMNSVSSLA